MGQKLSVDHSNDLTQGKSSPPPLILQPSPEAPAPVNLPTSPTSPVPGGKNGKERALPRPPSLLLRPERPDREASQSGSSTRAKSEDYQDLRSRESSPQSLGYRLET